MSNIVLVPIRYEGDIESPFASSSVASLGFLSRFFYTLCYVERQHQYM